MESEESLEEIEQNEPIIDIQEEKDLAPTGEFYKRLMEISKGQIEEGEDLILPTEKAKLMKMCSDKDAYDRESRSLVNVFELDPNANPADDG